MRRYPSVLLLLAAALLPACDNPFADDDGEVVLTARGDAWYTGDTVPLRLTNHSDETVIYSLCSLEFDVRDGDTWYDTEFGVALPCLGMVTVLEPGESASGYAPLPHGMLAGEYRVRTTVRGAHDQLSAEVATRGFRVEPGLQRAD